MYVAAELNPSALPRICGGMTDVRIAMEVPRIIALARPWMHLKHIRAISVGARAQPSAEAASNIMPDRKNLFLPNLSARLPIGSIKAAVVSRKPETTQFNMLWLALNSIPIVGMARLIAPLIKGVIKEVIITITSVILV